MIVESHDRFSDVGDFDPESGDLLEFSRFEAAPADFPEGHYAWLGGTLAVLYRVGGALWLRIGDEARVVDPDGASVVWDRAERLSRLRLIDQSNEVAAVEYVSHTDEVVSVQEDPTAFAEAEDWDFGLFVRNVLRDKDRRRRIYALNAE
jgi:hypothetical protein